MERITKFRAVFLLVLVSLVLSFFCVKLYSMQIADEGAAAINWIPYAGVGVVCAGLLYAVLSALVKSFLMHVPFLTAPTSVRRGYFFISILQPWSSVRCQWKVLSLCTSMMSRYLFTSSIPKK